MLTVSIIFAVLTVILFIVARMLKQSSDGDNKAAAKWVRISAMVTTVLAIVFLLFSGFRTIPAGNAGVQTLFGKVQPRALGEGLHLVNPLYRISKMTLQTQTYTMSSAVHEGQAEGNDALEIITKDDLTMEVEISVPFNLAFDAAPWVYRNLGVQYVESIIRPTIRSTVRDVFSKYTAQELYSTKREEAMARAQEKLQQVVDDLAKKKSYAGGTAIVIGSVLLRDVQLPAAVKHAIEEKIAAQQGAEKMEFVLQKEEKEADRKRVEAAGIRDFQKIVSQGISPELLEWKGIEATVELAKSPNSKVVVIGSGKDGLPLILGGNQ